MVFEERYLSYIDTQFSLGAVVKILSNGFSVSTNTEMGIGLKQNYLRWFRELESEIGWSFKFQEKGGTITIKPSPAYDSLEESRVLYTRFSNLLMRDGFWTAERVNELEKAALRGKDGTTRTGIAKIFAQFRELLSL